MIPRSWLYVPADDAPRLAKAATRGADALIVDLEDGVAPGMKAQARRNLSEFLESGEYSCALWVRVNSDPQALEEDLKHCIHPRLDGVVAAKTESASVLSNIVHRIETELGTPRGIMPLLETAQAVLDAYQIAAVPGVTQLQVGEADLRADLGVTFGPSEEELLTVRQQVVLVSAALKLLPPVAPVSVEFKDLEKFRRGSEALARMGYVGRACIHPAQVAVANEIFTPTPEDLARARALVSAAENAAASGHGAFVDDQGRMVDEAIVRSARRLLQMGE